MRKHLLIVLLMAVLVQPISAGEQVYSITGQEWLLKSGGEKLDYLMAAMFVLGQNGVEFRETPNDYFNKLQDELIRDHSLYSTDLKNILASIIYKTEPSNRAALEKIRKK